MSDINKEQIYFVFYRDYIFGHALTVKHRYPFTLMHCYSFIRTSRRDNLADGFCSDYWLVPA